MKGLEPSLSAWKADVLTIKHYNRKVWFYKLEAQQSGFKFERKKEGAACSFHGSYANRGSGTKRVSFDEVEPQVSHLREQKSVRPRAPSRRGCFNHPLCPYSAFSCFRFSGMFFLAGVQGVEPCPSRYRPGVLPATLYA